jgi:exonuclease III
LSIAPDVIMLQETWLTPANLTKFNTNFPNYFSFGSSAMGICVEQGPMKGRPYGGVMMLLKNDLRAFTQTICTSDRYVIIKLFNMIFVNVYLPCVGTIDRKSICEEMLNEIHVHLEGFSDCICIFEGDLNTNLDAVDLVSRSIKCFASDHNLCRCDALFNCSNVFTYINDSLGNCSCVDYILTSDLRSMMNYYVIDSGSNLSDHLPVVMVCRPNLSGISIPVTRLAENKRTVTHLRWDHADLDSYYYLMGVHLQDLLDDIKAFEQMRSDPKNCDINCVSYIDSLNWPFDIISSEKIASTATNCMRRCWTSKAQHSGSAGKLSLNQASKLSVRLTAWLMTM